MPATPNDKSKLTYRDAGVDIDAGNVLVEAIGPLAAKTKRAGLLGCIGGFGGLFDLKACGFKDPVLVAATDGVGTKLKLAIETGIHDGIGIDLVAMNVNDIVVQGAEPLFFLDYFATGTLDLGVAKSVIGSVAKGCKEAGAALIGGETAEMPGVYAPGDYDLAGFAVGAVERKALLPRKNIEAGDVILALPSSGVHANGFSLVRRVVKETGSTGAIPRRLPPARRSVRRCSHRPASMSGRFSIRFAEPQPSRRSHTSPAAASPTTSRACCRRVLPPRSTSAPSLCRRCSPGSYWKQDWIRRRCCARSTAASA